MDKSKEQDVVTTTKNGVSTAKVVNTVVKDGKLVSDESSHELGVRQ
jgi:hypothetical protein